MRALRSLDLVDQYLASPKARGFGFGRARARLRWPPTLPDRAGNARRQSVTCDDNIGLISRLWLPRTQIRAYRWCNPPTIGCAIMSPNRSIGRVQGASLPSERCVRTSL